MVAGGIAGGGMAAGMALAARDRGGPALCGQLLDYPMLDDRGITPSTGQFDGVGVWDRVSNETPARATDLSRRPRSSTSARRRSSGTGHRLRRGPVDGGFHAFDIFAPHTVVERAPAG